MALQHWPWQIASPGGALSLAVTLFVISLWCHPLIPSFLSRAESWPSCFVLEQPGFIPVCPCNALTNTHWVYPYNTLQHPFHILGLPHHMQHRLTYYPACPLHTSHRAHTNNKLLDLFKCEASLHTSLDYLEWCCHCRSSLICYHFRYKPPTLEYLTPTTDPSMPLPLALVCQSGTFMCVCCWLLSIVFIRKKNACPLLFGRETSTDTPNF